MISSIISQRVSRCRILSVREARDEMLFTRISQKISLPNIKYCNKISLQHSAHSTGHLSTASIAEVLSWPGQAKRWSRAGNTSDRVFVCFRRDSPQWTRAPSFNKFLDHTQRRTTGDRTPLEEGSARRRDLYLTTLTTKSMFPAGFEPTISAGERSQTYALDRADTGTGCDTIDDIKYLILRIHGCLNNFEALQDLKQRRCKIKSMG